MDWVVRLVSAVRAVRAEMNVPPSARLQAHVRDAGAATLQRLQAHGGIIQTLARLESIAVAGEAPISGAVQVVVDEATVILPLAGIIDVAQEQARLTKELGKLDGELTKLDKKLANDAFISKADPEVVQEHRDRREEYALNRARVADALERLKAM
jgi:valyl-tRNA synthetase